MTTHNTPSTNPSSFVEAGNPATSEYWRCLFAWILLDALMQQGKLNMPSDHGSEKLIPAWLAFLRNATEELSQKYFSNLAKHRHMSDMEAKELVQEAWRKNPYQFRTAIEASEFYSDWLVKEKGFRRYKARTVYVWLNECAKEIGIRWR